jgi:hypothetical protein
MSDDRNLCLEVDRASLGHTRLLETTLPALAADSVRLRIERVALTANTVTYAVTGAQLGYWDFYPAQPGWGRVPAMGWATVVESTHPALATGTRHYGWLPFARYVDLVAAPNHDGLRDDGPHRAAHAPIYRAFPQTSRDALYQPGAELEDRHALLRGLFLTGFLADDFLGEQDHFGARQVLVISASSKTAIGYAEQAMRRGGIELIGLTSSRNLGFVRGLGCYHRVIDYAAIESLDPAVPSVAIDMSGNGEVLGRIHAHFADALRHSMAIGRSHHDSPSRAAVLPGPKPRFFFAPTQAGKRVQDWGAAGLQARTREALWAFVDGSRRWLTIEHHYGDVATTAAWQSAYAGDIGPERGLIVSLWDTPPAAA